MAKWFTSFDEKQIRLPAEIEQIPDIFVDIFAVHSLLRTRKRLAFCRVPVRRCSILRVNMTNASLIDSFGLVF